MSTSNAGSTPFLSGAKYVRTAVDNGPKVSIVVEVLASREVNVGLVSARQVGERERTLCCAKAGGYSLTNEGELGSFLEVGDACFGLTPSAAIAVRAFLDQYWQPAPPSQAAP